MLEPPERFLCARQRWTVAQVYIRPTSPSHPVESERLRSHWKVLLTGLSISLRMRDVSCGTFLHQLSMTNLAWVFTALWLICSIVASCVSLARRVCVLPTESVLPESSVQAGLPLLTASNPFSARSHLAHVDLLVDLFVAASVFHRQLRIDLPVKHRLPQCQLDERHDCGRCQPEVIFTPHHQS